MSEYKYLYLNICLPYLRHSSCTVTNHYTIMYLGSRAARCRVQEDAGHRGAQVQQDQQPSALHVARCDRAAPPPLAHQERGGLAAQDDGPDPEGG